MWLVTFLWAVLGFLMVTLFNILETDRKLRNAHAAKVSEYGTNPLPSVQTLPPVVVGRVTPDQYERWFQIAVFLCVAALDFVGTLHVAFGWL
jgi:hypothetical protein